MKQGLDQSQNEFLCSQKGIFIRGIPRNFIINSKVDLNLLSCQICGNIIWKPITCSQLNCFANYCSYCVSNLSREDASSQQQQQPNLKCPKCSKVFLKTSIPLINNLLSDLQLKCIYSADQCKQTIKYDQYLKHCLNCDFRKTQCLGCQKKFAHKLIEQHKKICSSIVVKCNKCNVQLPQSQFKIQHTQLKCLQSQLSQKTSCIAKLQSSVQKLKQKLSQYQHLMTRIINGDNFKLPYQLYTSFPSYFIFTNTQVKLCKNLWNHTKQKYDFLHFYLSSKININSPIGYQWKIILKCLKGNMLIGICSSLDVNSIDIMINRFGQIKKKQPLFDKYKLIRKSNITFEQGDILNFKYIAPRKMLKIYNQTKKLQCKIQTLQINTLGDNLYNYYCLDTLNDTIKFI